MKKTFAIALCAVVMLASAPIARADDDVLGLIEKKKAELAEKEEALKKEEERLNSLKDEVGKMLDKYTETLNQIETALKSLEDARTGNVKQLVKTFESMAAEEAAQRIAALPEKTAATIINGMSTRKAGAVLASMSPEMVARIAERIEKIVKKIPE